MKRSICVAAALLLLSGCNAQASTYDEALNAYSHNRVSEAETALKKIVANPAVNAADKARAYRELARIAWLIDGNTPAALAALGKADATGQGGCENAMLRARILQGSSMNAELLEQAETLAGRCSEPAEASAIRLHAAEAALDVAASEAAVNKALVDRAQALAEAMIADKRSSLEGSALRLQIAILRSDAPAALQAWKDYFWLSDTDVPQGMRHAHPAAAPLFAAALATDAGPEPRLQLIDLLMRAGFATIVERFAAATGLPAQAAQDPRWRKASAYLRARRELEAAILASNRRVARGGKAADLEAATKEATTRLMAAAGLQGDSARELRKAYGLSGQVGNTDGYASVHFGHVVQDERRTIEQYGHRADVAFLSLDNMISNGFNSWLWDGTAAAGGWTAPGPLIVQVRPEWTSNPLSAWSLFSGGADRQRLLARQPSRAAADVAALKHVSVAYLPGLADRLKIQSAEQIGARAKQLAGAGGDLKRAFLAEYSRATFEQSILGHEGRHALDRKLVRGLARLSDSNLEYRAKLSELALADYPRLAFNNINEPAVGGSSGHGKADERVLEAYAAWIRKNSQQIVGYDPALPALVQLDKLSDDQLRAIARELDPIAPK